jgi:hypothetical protein
VKRLLWGIRIMGSETFCTEDDDFTINVVEDPLNGDFDIEEVTVKKEVKTEDAAEYFGVVELNIKIEPTTDSEDELGSSFGFEKSTVKEEFEVDVKLESECDFYHLGDVEEQFSVDDNLRDNLKVVESDSSKESNENVGKKGRFQCPQCSYQTDSQRPLISHLKAHIEKKKPYTCVNCSFTSFSKSALSVHKVRCTLVENKLHCPHCNYLTIKHKYLNKHMKLNHSENPVYVCKKCPFSTCKWKLVGQHEKKHIKTHKCAECAFETSCKDALRKHVHEMHTKFKHKCEACAFATSSKFKLCQHKKEKHKEAQGARYANAKVYRCDLCPYISVRCANVRRHRKIHLKERKEGSEVISLQS